MEKKNVKEIPDHIIDLFLEKYKKYPCINRTNNITKDGLNVLTLKNKILWYNRILLSDITIEIEGLIEYGKFMIYYIRNNDESVYRLYILNENINGDLSSFNLLINGLKKYYTIN